MMDALQNSVASGIGAIAKSGYLASGFSDAIYNCDAQVLG
jgi:hypothetical protein